jgi:predicted dehydrogenase
VAKSKKKIVIIGAGQLGSRYLQGLSKCEYGLRIYVVDTDPEALRVAEKRWLEVKSDKKDKVASFHTEVDTVVGEVDIIIVATTARNRVELVVNLKQNLSSRFWILEKILTQNTEELDRLISVMASDQFVWVNLPRRMLSWHKSIRERLVREQALHLRVSGTAWGLTCNSIHFLDMLAWFSGETLTHISTSGLAQTWFKAKRPGNWEVIGEFEAHFSGGSTATIIVEEGDPVDLIYQFRIEDGDLFWSIDEENGTAIRSDGLSVPGRLPFQSEVTPLLVDEILSTGKCELPSLEISAETHRVFLDAMLMHWKKTVDASATTVPIT